MFKKLIITLFLIFIINVESIFAQVSEEDSLALIALYDSTNGDNWTHNDNWKNGPVDTWYGVTVLGDRVRMLYLNSNRLTGSIPPEIGNLTSLELLYLDDNQLTGSIPPEIVNLTSLAYLLLYNNDLVDLPSLSGLSPHLFGLYIQNNKFTFEDIEPNILVPSISFIYSPQDSIGESQDTTIPKGSNFTISISVGGENNQYQWKKNGIVISGATDNSYTISSAETGDEGSYVCSITNTVATELTLYSRPVTVTVSSYIRVTSPNGGEDWQVDSTYDITWTSIGTTGNVRIEYSTNNGFSWIQEATSTPDDGCYSWRIPDKPSDSCLVRVENWSGSPSDISNSVFRISSSSAIPLAKLPEVYSFGVKGITIGNSIELTYTIPEETSVRFTMYDITGKIVKEFSEEKKPGFYSREIDMNGKSTGVYFIRIEANGKRFTKTDKVVIVK